MDNVECVDWLDDIEDWNQVYIFPTDGEFWMKQEDSKYHAILDAKGILRCDQVSGSFDGSVNYF